MAHVRRCQLSGFRSALFVATLCATWFTCALAAQADCLSPGFNTSGTFCNGCKYEGSMTMARDQTCERAYHPPPQTKDIPPEFLSNRVVQRAKHGVAGANANSFAYAPSKGYVGQDDFVVEVAYRQGKDTGKFSVHWHVVVQ